MIRVPDHWELMKFLRAHARMSVSPTSAPELRVGGMLDETMRGADGPALRINYEIQMSFAPGFPERTPVVRETSGRIPSDFHTQPDGSLCLGSPLRLHVLCRDEPTIAGFFESVVLPYLYSHAHAVAHDRMPWGELKHNAPGLIEDYCDMLKISAPDQCRTALDLLGVRRRVANKRLCFCGSGIRLGRCHNIKINRLRRMACCSRFRAFRHDASRR